MSLEEAFSLLKTLHETGWFWRLDSNRDNVICTIQNQNRKTFSVEAPTPQQAIAECALRIIDNGKT